MGLKPNIKKEKKFQLKQCPCCGGTFGPEGFAPTKSIFYLDGTIPLCNDCIEQYLKEHDFDWECVDKICQMMDLPFVPKEWERLREMNGDKVFPIYAEVFLDGQYDGIGWGDYYKEFRRLRDAEKLNDELPALDAAHRQKQRER